MLTLKIDGFLTCHNINLKGTALNGGSIVSILQSTEEVV